MKRRDFLAAGAAAGLAGCAGKRPPPLPPGELIGPNMTLGHRLRDGGAFPPPSETRRVDALIVGAGMAGLACGWWLARNGQQDFAVLELENEAGGNCLSGRNALTAYPWGAHYLPLPGTDAPELRQMLAEFGVLRGDPFAARPEYEERHLCFNPQERLFINGVWQDGLLPHFGIGASERAQQQRFIDRMSELGAARDHAGKAQFTVPSARGGERDRALDSVTMRDWLRREGFDAPSLHWWVNYACRDDYGTDYSQASAWAGIHYFAGRHGLASNADSDTVLTWPEGNGWLSRRLAARLAPWLRANAMVWRIAADKTGVDVDVYLAREQRSVRYRAARLVWAGPVGFLPHIWPDLPPQWRAAAARFSYAPWLVANLSVQDVPAQVHEQAPLSWDNVLYQGQGLGYVVANHQSLALHGKGSVLTYYRPLSEASPAAGRQLLRTRTREQWAQSILADLSRAHPDILDLTTRLDVCRWGHAMARPTVGLLDGHLLPLRQPQPRVMLAHADLSGFSLAEEAHYWGIRAARWLLGDKGTST
ncbi:FAD-dependent oxidoreductase [Chitinimonas arctica]|uniref:FAD-dependent oxidoreductase n=1 Tax=Chitinimonas arctica TaxID=2594795 RepID=A0A516SG92_9NEIS|nr:NAD(P)/FAD-dependent oxidoreductase [Chitinimonas arctica]QDQ27184.1 FAD-dependent oxidoreductase [Chitinimonas arctica]